MQESERIWKNQHESACIYHNPQQSERICKSLQQTVSTHKHLKESEGATRIY